MQKQSFVVQDSSGNLVSNPVVTVYESDGATLATIYNASGQPLDNPFTGGFDGWCNLSAEDGQYVAMAESPSGEESQPIYLQFMDRATLVAEVEDRANHTGTQSADTIVDGTTNKVFTEEQKTKLSGVEDGATQNSTDATLLDRANHTGTQSISTLSDLDAEMDSRDTANRSRSNHTGTQAASTVTGIPGVSVTSTASSSSQSIEEWISELEQRIITLEGA